MVAKRILLEGLGTILVLCSLYFFYVSVRFLTEKDYVAGVLEIFVGLAVIRAGIELQKLAVVVQVDE